MAFLQIGLLGRLCCSFHEVQLPFSISCGTLRSTFIITCNNVDIRLRYCRQFSSSYLPVAPLSSPPPSSRDSSRDNNSRRSKDSKSRQNEASNPKRRSTMNSRDAAYDEEEQLRRAIEESKEENKSTADEVATRRGKRSRSDSEA